MTKLECNLYVRGVPARGTLVEVQPLQVIDLFGARAWPAQYLEVGAAVCFAKMRDAAAADGVHLWIRSAYRSHSQQQLFYRQWEQGKRRLRPATPGWSLHESGKAVDIQRSHDDPDGGGPQRGRTDEWLEQNARRFSFYRTVPAELWHWEHKE